MFCTAWPDAPFTKLSMAEKMINLSLILVSQIDISQLLVFKTLPDPRGVFKLSTLTNFEFLNIFAK